MGKRKTHEQFITEMAIINPNIEILGEYQGVKIKIKCRCKIDNYEWECTPTHLLHGTGCPKCSNHKKKTHEEFVQELALISPNIEVLGQYKNAQTKIKCRCKIDGYEWEAKPNTLLRPSGCPKCAGNIQKTHEEFIQEMAIISPNIEILGKYINSYTKIKCRCKIDGFEWMATPTHLLQPRGCPKCALKIKGDKLKKSHEQFIHELELINPDIEVLEEYQGAHVKIKCCCKLDGYEWYSEPNALLRNVGCPQCTTSKGEKRVGRFLENHAINFMPQYTFKNCKDKQVLPFDFYLIDYNTAIEYDGDFHYRPIVFGDELTLKQAEENLKITQKHDAIKTQYCADNNIKLIRIPYWDFDNIEEILTKELLT